MPTTDRSTGRGDQPASTTPAPQQSRFATLWRYRTIDLVTIAMLGVAVGIAFWGWSQLYHVISALSLFAFPPISGVLSGPWLLGGVLGGLIVRRPGAALITEMIAASVEALLGNGWGFTNLISGAAQGIGVELVLALVLYRRFGVWVSMLSATVAGAIGTVYLWVAYYADWTWTYKWIYLVGFAVSGAITAGLVGWLLVRALARTGVLDAFGPGREHHARLQSAGD